MTTRLIIARHGNTFGPNDTPTRVGARTDLPLVESGLEQGRKLGLYLRANNLLPDIVFTSELKRTQQTAEQALQAAGITRPLETLAIFNEIDYGPDENKPEAAVIARIGEQAIKDWEDKAIVPQGWLVNPKTLIQNWLDFGQHITNSPPPLGGVGDSSFPSPFGGRAGVGGNTNQTILVVTSNGIARFAPHLTGDFEGFRRSHKIKIATGALCLLTHDVNAWRIVSWNIKP